MSEKDKNNGTVDLSALLDPYQVQALAAAGLLPGDHTALTMQASKVQLSQRLPDGSYVMLLHVPLPAGTFVEQRARLALPGRPNAGDLDGAIPISPTVQVVVRKDRLREPAKQQLEAALAAQLVALSTLQPPPPAAADDDAEEGSP